MSLVYDFFDLVFFIYAQVLNYYLIQCLYFVIDVLVLNDIINQTAAVSDPSTEVVVVKQPRNSLQSVGTPTDGAGGGTGGTSGAPSGGAGGAAGGGGGNSDRGLKTTSLKLERARRESRKISMMLDDEEEEGPRLKERLTEACQQFVDIFCVWDCCWLYIKLSEVRTIFIEGVSKLNSLEFF